MLPPHLARRTIPPLVAYLEQLSGVPGAENVRKVLGLPTASGEHIIKSACHVCHSATDPIRPRIKLWKGDPSALFPCDSREPAGVCPESDQRRADHDGLSGNTLQGQDAGVLLLESGRSVAAYMYLLRYPPRP